MWNRIDSAWVEMAEGVRRGDAGKSPHRCAEIVQELVELAAFEQLCRRKQLLPPSTLTGYSETGCPDLLIDAGAWERALSLMADIDGPPEILAIIHRRLLGGKLVAGKGGRWRPESEGAAAKAGGVFYTPSHVAKYIAENALEAFFNNDSRREADCHIPTLLDPSCGCGAFLLAAFRALSSRLPSGADRVACGRDILRHIHGVDIDAQAVLVARRSLWLEMMADRPSRGTDGDDFLTDTIRVGNVLCDEFPATVSDAPGKFDIIIGNPPYRRELGAKSLLDQVAAAQLGRRWRTVRMDLWYYFVHRGLELLCDDGVLGFIVSGYWTSGSGSQKLLEQLNREAHIDEVFDLDRLDVFPNVGGRHMIIRISKNRRQRPTIIKWAASAQSSEINQSSGTDGGIRSLLNGSATLSVFEKTAEQLFRHGRIDLEPPHDEFLGLLARGTPLGRLGKVRQGIAENPSAINLRTNRKFCDRWSVGEGVFVLTPEEVAALDLPESEKTLLRPYHVLCDLGRYKMAARPSRFLIYSTAETWGKLDMFPVLGRHLQRFGPIMENRRETRLRRRNWWQLHWPRDVSLWQSAKVISVQMAAHPAFVPSLGTAYVPFSANVFVPDDSVKEHPYYFAAVLNSRLLWQWYRHHAKRRGVGLEINGRNAHSSNRFS